MVCLLVHTLIYSRTNIKNYSLSSQVSHYIIQNRYILFIVFLLCTLSSLFWKIIQGFNLLVSRLNILVCAVDANSGLSNVKKYSWSLYLIKWNKILKYIAPFSVLLHLGTQTVITWTSLDTLHLEHLEKK